jgi:hypothetical protein
MNFEENRRVTMRVDRPRIGFIAQMKWIKERYPVLPSVKQKPAIKQKHSELSLRKLTKRLYQGTSRISSRFQRDIVLPALHNHSFMHQQKLQNQDRKLAILPPLRRLRNHELTNHTLNERYHVSHAIYGNFRRRLEDE